MILELKIHPISNTREIVWMKSSQKKKLNRYSLLIIENITISIQKKQNVRDEIE
jgi:hypothetical protein